MGMHYLLYIFRFKEVENRKFGDVKGMPIGTI